MKKNFKNFLALALVALAACTVGLSTKVSAGGWDNNGQYYNYMRGVHKAASTASVSGLTTKSLAKVKIMFDGCEYGAMIPQFNQQLNQKHRARVVMQCGGQGTSCDGIVSCMYGTVYSPVGKNLGVESDWQTCYWSEVDFWGYSYWDACI
ncbi:MAG: hypothetical protein E7510_07335 [Ruminococcus sp.]|nr:hypothetical protein [Ruminococcus sp.]